MIHRKKIILGFLIPIFIVIIFLIISTEGYQKYEFNVANIMRGYDTNGNEIKMVICIRVYDSAPIPCEYHFANGTSIVSKKGLLDSANISCGAGTLFNNGSCQIPIKFDCSYLEDMPIPDGSIRGIVLHECNSPFDITQVFSD